MSTEVTLQMDDKTQQTDPGVKEGQDITREEEKREEKLHTINILYGTEK